MGISGDALVLIFDLLWSRKEVVANGKTLDLEEVQKFREWLHSLGILTEVLLFVGSSHCSHGGVSLLRVSQAQPKDLSKAIKEVASLFRKTSTR
eukprot:CAMPEP_0117736918 /NCGR_PEP_ID=MMETSP0947-20121206/2218_1 /TAXON_ID=44440 /ORGANISM="Chattonella subsalsa, Strain CCMP2191" /LENGTH=93 /DNA_ID=CAMNT_0005552305 /DNA_START=542 /DNA_END=823 /DNA_ORIENTATION=+